MNDPKAENDQESEKYLESEEYLELVRLEDEFEAMCNDYDAARRSGEYNTARRLGKEVCAFARLHQHTLDMPDEQIEKLAAICRKHEARRRLLEIPENELKKIERNGKRGGN